MSLQFKRNTPRDYSNLKVLFEDTSQTSPKFFRVSDVPQVLTKGKNLLRISAHPSNLVPNSQIIVDIKDTNGDPIYFEVPDYLEQDKSRVISIWIYHDKDDFNTANGDATITIYGIARVDQNGKQVPSRYRGKHNVKWSTTINVDRDRENISPVIFKGDILPTISISESIEAYQNLPSTGTELELTTQTGGGARYIYKGRTPIVQLTDGSEFNHEMVEYSLQLGNFEVPATPETRFENPTNITSYTSSIKELIDSTTVILNAPFTTTFDDREDLTHTFTSIESAEYSISYFQTSSNIVTENQRSYANLTISNVNPISGYPNKLRLLIKSDGLPGDYELLNEVTVPFSSSLSVKIPIPSEHLEDPKRIKVQYLNSIGEISRTETITEPYKFVGGNYYFGGRNNLISGSMFISNALGSGIELGGVSSGFIRSVGFEGQTSASLGKGPGGFVIYSGSGNLQLGEDVLTGVGMQMVGDNDDRHLIFTTDNGGLLDVKTDKFFIGTTDTQFISGSDGNIEISSSLFHLDPQNNLLVIGADAVINADLTVNNLRTPALINGVQSTRANSSSSIDEDGFARFVSASIGGFEVSETQINSANDNLILKDSGQITGSNVSFTGGTIAGFEISNSQINSTNNNIILKANGQLTASDGFLFGDKDTSQYVQYDDGNLVVRGDLSVDEIFTPALIGGSPANITNASSSITSDGFAKFVSASIGGWSVDTGSIQGSNIIMLPEGTIQTKDFATNVKGWKISSLGNGTAEFENVRIRGTLKTTVFEKETVNAVGGQLYIANSTTLSGSADIIYNATASISGSWFESETGVILINESRWKDRIFNVDIPHFTSYTSGSLELYDTTGLLTGSINPDVKYEYTSSAQVGYGSLIVTSSDAKGVTFSDNSVIRSREYMTIVVWAKPYELNDNGQGAGIIWKNLGYGIRIDTTNYQFFGYDGGYKPANGGTPVIDEWVHLVLVRSGSSITGYQNGAQVATRSDLGSLGDDTGTSLNLGYQTNTNNSFAGEIGHVSMYDIPFTATEVSESYNALRNRYTDTPTYINVLSSNPSETLLTVDRPVLAKDSWFYYSGSLIETTYYPRVSATAFSSSYDVTGSIPATAEIFRVENASGFAIGEILKAKKVSNTGFATEYLKVTDSFITNPSSDTDLSGFIHVERAYGKAELEALAPEDQVFLTDLVSLRQSYEEGQVIVSTGLIGSGYIHLNANPRDQSTPYMDIVERTGSGVYDTALKVRLGDLSGLANSTYVFGNPNPGFGLATDNVFLQGGIIANTGSIGGINMDAGKLYTGVGTWGNLNTGFYLDSESSMSLSDKLRWDGTQLTISGVINIESGTGFATQSDINTATGSLSSSISTTINDVSGSISTTINDVSGSISTTINDVSGSIVNTISTVSGSIATDIASNVDKIVTDANNKIVKPNPAPSGDGLFLASTNMGYYDNSDWNAYISSSGEFLFKADDDNLISFGNSSFVLKVSDQAVISGSQISLLTPNFFFGGTNQFISGANSNIEISSSNFHLQPNGDVVIGGGATIEQGAVFGVLPALPSNEKLKVYIPFEEGGGTKVFNHANESEPLTIQNSSGFTRISGSNTAYGNSLFLEGTFLKFDSGNDASAIIHDGGTQVSQSIVVWLNTPSASISTPQIIYEQNGSTNGQSLFISNGQVYWSIWTSGGAGDKRVVSSSLNDSELTMIGATVDSNIDQMKIYKNGFVQQVLNAPITVGGGNECGIGGVASSTRIISGSESGTVYTTDGDIPYYGMIDEFRIYKEYLSDSNMLALYQNPGGVSSTTKITGDNISTGQIKSNNLSATQGTLIDLNGEVFKIGGTSVTPTSGEGIVLDGSVTDQPKFFVGNTSNAFVRFGETAGALEISSSGFSLDTTGAITATEGTIGGITIDSGKLFTGVGTWGNFNTGFYVDSESSMSLSDKLRWDGTQLTISGVINIESGTGFATQANINTATGSLSSSIATSITTVSSSFSSSLSGVSGSIVNTVSTVSGSIVNTVSTVSGSIVNTISTVSGSIASDIENAVDRIVTDANNKITKPNPAPSGDGLFLASTNMGYYDNSDWNAYISSSGEFLFKADDDNLISFGNSSFVLKVSDQAVISGSQISLLTPNFFFGGTNQFISGANSNIEISSSNFHLDSNGDVTLSGNITVTNAGDFANPNATSTLNYNFAGNGSQTLDTGIWTLLNISGQTASTSGIRIVRGGSPTTDWYGGIRTIKEFPRSESPVLIFDWTQMSPSGITTANSGITMIGWWTGDTSTYSNRMYYGIYIYQNNIYSRAAVTANASVATLITNNAAGDKWRCKIRLKAGGGAMLELFRNGDFITPAATYDWGTTGTLANLAFGLSQYKQGDSDLTLEQVAIGSQPATTTISGNGISTGQIESTNLSTTQGTLIDLDDEIFKIGGTLVTPTSGEGIVLDGSIAGQPKFFVGDAASAYVRFGETAGALEISSSRFSLDTTGAVTATELLVESNGVAMIDTSTGFTDGTNVVRHLPFTATSETRFIAKIPGENYIQLLFFTTSNVGTATANWYPLDSPSATGFGSLITQSVTWGTGPPSAINKTLVRAVFPWSGFTGEKYGRLSFTLSGVTNTSDIQVITYRNFQPEDLTAETIIVAS
jgi:hypothetical protein